MVRVSVPLLCLLLVGCGASASAADEKAAPSAKSLGEEGADPTAPTWAAAAHAISLVRSAGRPPLEPAPEPEPEPDEEESPCVDEDGDGFFVCHDDELAFDGQLDCDDSRWFVQPGGYEFPGNGRDDNCDGLVDDEEIAACACAPDGTSDVAAVTAAMGLCDDTVVDVSAPAGEPAQRGVFSTFHDDVRPRQGECLATLSNGNADGHYAEYGQLFCEDIFAGCDPDPAPDSDGHLVFDLAQLEVQLDPPRNARGLEVDLMFLSVEWPDYLCSPFNDSFYLIVESPSVNDGNPTNIAIDPAGKPVSVNCSFFEHPSQWSVPLGQTPYGAPVEDEGCTDAPLSTCQLPGYCDDDEAELGWLGSGSGWLTTRMPVDGEAGPIKLTFSIHDELDGALDSLVVIDKLRWTPYEPGAGTSKDDG